MVKCDLTVDKQLFHLKQSVIEKFGKLDVLINCAGKYYGQLIDPFRQYLRR